MISHQKKFIFFHNSRTGGTSIEKALGKYAEYSPSNKAEKPEFRKHALLPLIRDRVGEEIFKSYFKFAFVRNPFSRLYSKYRWGIEICNDEQGIRKLGFELSDWKRATFDEWVDRFYFAENLFEKRPTWGPQKRLLFDYEKSAYMVDFIGRFEDLTKDFESIANRLGISERLPAVYSTTPSDYRQHYSTASKEIAEKIFVEDLNEFDYEF